MSRLQVCQIRARLPRPRTTFTIMKLVPALRAVTRCVHEFLRVYTPAHTVVKISCIGFLHPQVLEKAFAAGMAAGSMLISKVLDLAAPLACVLRILDFPYVGLYETVCAFPSILMFIFNRRRKTLMNHGRLFYTQIDTTCLRNHTSPSHKVALFTNSRSCIGR